MRVSGTRMTAHMWDQNAGAALGVFARVSKAACCGA
jgi:hypothetical protein